MSYPYQTYPGLAESPPLPTTLNNSCAKIEPFDSELERGSSGWKRQLSNASSDSWAPQPNAYIGNDRFLEMGRRDSPSSSSAAFYQQSSATLANNLQDHYTQNSNSSATFSEEFRGRYFNDPSQCAFPSDVHSRTKSRFDEIVDEGHANRVPISSAVPDRERSVYGDNGDEEIQMGNKTAVFSVQSAAMTQPNYQQHEEELKNNGQPDREFFKPPTPSSTSALKKRTFTQISGFDPSADPSAKNSRTFLISYPAAPPAVLKSYSDDRRYMLCYLQQNQRQNPLDMELQSSLIDLRQEVAFIDSLDPTLSNCLANSKRLLVNESLKLEEWHNPDWVEVDHNRPIKLSKQILIPTFRYPTINFIGRIVGFKGSTLSRICRKYKCFISILGANSSKDHQQEIELLQSGDYRYAHYASPLHIRVDVIAPTHLAHMRMAAVLNLFHKLLIPNRDFDVDAELADVDLSENREKSKSKNEKMQRWAEEERRWESEFEEANNGSGRTDGRKNYRPWEMKTSLANGTEERRQNGSGTSPKNATLIPTPSSPVTTPLASPSTQRAGTAGRGGRGGGFVPRGMRPRGEDKMNGC